MTKQPTYFRRIHDLRVDSDKTQQQIADYLYCSRTVYSRYERGVREIPVSFLSALSSYYQVSVDYLLGISNKKEKT